MRICIFGDSIAWGAKDYEKGGWVERLKMFYLKNNDEVEIYNLGISGDNTDNLLRRFETEASARQPDVIVFEVGINDSWHTDAKDNNGVNLQNFERNLFEIAQMAKIFTDKIVFIGITVVDESKTMPIPWNSSICYTNENIEKYDLTIRKLCQNENLFYVDLQKIIGYADLEDGLHPNSEGHNKIYQKLREIIDSFI